MNNIIMIKHQKFFVNDLQFSFTNFGLDGITNDGLEAVDVSLGQVVILLLMSLICFLLIT